MYVVNLFFRSFSFSSLVPDANILASRLQKFFTMQFPIPPVAPVIRTLLFLNSFLRFLISAIELIEKLLHHLMFVLPFQSKLFLDQFQ